MQAKKSWGLIIIVIFCSLWSTSPMRATTPNSFPSTVPAAPTPVSPFAACTFGGAGTVYTNAEVEPWVVVNPTNPNNIVAVWQQDRWSNGGARGLVTSATHDGGLTWKRNWAHVSQCSGGNASNGANYARTSDPWLAFAPNGDLYQTSLSVTFSPLATAVLISKSTDGGDTWSTPRVLQSDADARFFNDKEAVTADPDDFHYVYVVWDRLNQSKPAQNEPEQEHEAGTRAPAMFARTTDAGQTWETPRVIYDPGPNNATLANQIVVQPNGALVNFFSESVTPPNRGRNAPPDVYVSLVRSADKGATWGKVVRAVKLAAHGARNPDTDKSIRALGVIPEVAVDPRNGALYAVWQDARFRKVDEVAFIQSTDGGATWSTPIRINQTPTSTIPLNQQALLPAIHVAADGTLAVTYYDFRNNTPAAGVPTDYWFVTCRPTATTPCTDPANWRHEQRLTTASFDLTQAPTANNASTFFLGDYQGLTNIGDSFFSLFIGVNNGNPNNRTSVFYARITPPVGQ
ncbi:MAG: sialidase family protein [Caldilineaceae bacterium]